MITDRDEWKLFTENVDEEFLRTAEPGGMECPDLFDLIPFLPEDIREQAKHNEWTYTPWDRWDGSRVGAWRIGNSRFIIADGGVYDEEEDDWVVWP